MMATFMRPPRDAVEVFADAMRALGLISVVVAMVWWSPVDGAVFGLVLLGLVLPRFLGVRPALDIAFGVTLLIAGWSAVLDIYLTTRWWDIPVHFALNGTLAAVLYIMAIRFGVVPDPVTQRVPVAAMVVLTVCFGIAAGVLWEWGEWAGHTFIDETIFVGYEDTLGDLAVGAAGAAVAGLSGRYLAGESRWVGQPAVAAAAV